MEKSRPQGGDTDRVTMARWLLDGGVGPHPPDADAQRCVNLSPD